MAGVKCSCNACCRSLLSIYEGILTVGLVQSIGNILGEFSTGVGAGATKAIVAQQAQWITIAARPKAVCIAESGNVINTVYVRCRNGRQEFVRFDANGQKIVLSERPIPLY